MSIRHVVVGVEGEVSEVALIKGVLYSLRQQAPHGYAHLEVVALPLSGNQGYSDALIDKYEDAVKKYKEDPKNCVEEDDEIIKVLVCDYDDMQKHGVNEKGFRKKVEKTGATIVMSKPKFELFVALIICGKEVLTEKLTRRVDLTTIINDGIDNYNDMCKYDFLKIPPYSKRHYQADNWFLELFDRNPEFLKRALETNFGNAGDDYYTEVPELMRMIGGYFK